MICKKLYFWPACIVLFIIFTSKATLADPHEKRLLDKLLNDYNSLERPVLNVNDTMEIKIGLTLTNILELEAVEGRVLTYMWLTLRWVDVNLVWNSSDYDGIKSLNIPSYRIWKPNVLLRNSLDISFDGTSLTNAVVSNVGKCTYITAGLFRSPCLTDVTNYPFDEHNCSFNFGSWTHNTAGINFQLESISGGDFSRLMPNLAWELFGFPGRVDQVYYSYDPDPYNVVTFIMECKRRGETIFSGYSFAIILGVLGTILSFLLPPTPTHRIPLGIMALLSIFWMGYSIHTLLSSKPSKLESYFWRLTYLIIISIISNIVIVYFHNLDLSHFMQRIPAWSRKILFDIIPRLILLSRPNINSSSLVPIKRGGSARKILLRTESQDQYEEPIPDLQGLIQMIQEKQNQSSTVNDWQYFVIILDRIAFLFFLLASILFYIFFYCAFI